MTVGFRILDNANEANGEMIIPNDRLTGLVTSIRLAGALLCLSSGVAADAIDDLVARQMEEQAIPGLALYVYDDGEVIKLGGYGLANLEHDVPVSKDTLFQSGSVGKQFTATAIMILAERGKLSLVDTYGKYFPAAPAHIRQLTIGQLLSHTGGLSEYPSGLDVRSDYSPEAVLAAAYADALLFEPGTDYSYSNTGYILLGFLVERITGQHYAEFITEKIFRPAKMEHATPIDELAITPGRSQGYQIRDGVLLNQSWVSQAVNSTADGSLYLSVEDMAAWDTALRKGSLLSAESRDALWTVYPLANGEPNAGRYGLGWFVRTENGTGVLSHGGDWQGFRSYTMRTRTSDFSITVLTNLAADSGSRPKDIAWAVIDHLRPDLTRSRRGAPEHHGTGNHPQKGTVLAGGWIVDGSGAPRYRGDVRIQNDRITEVGEVVRIPDDAIIDIGGKVVTPGFIDAHNHSDSLLALRPTADSQIRQGITTLVVGQDGYSPGFSSGFDNHFFPPAMEIGAFLDAVDAIGVSANVATLVGHASARMMVMGDDYKRAATASEISRMQEIVAQAMRAGAFGLSTGLEYEEGRFAPTGEVAALAETAARYSGVYVSHIRNEEDEVFSALEEALQIGRQTGIPIHISHLKLASRSVWNRSRDVVDLIGRANRLGLHVTADCYPYDGWLSTIRVIVLSREFEDRALVSESIQKYGGPEHIEIKKNTYFPELEGMTLDDVAKAFGTTYVDAYQRLASAGDVPVVGRSMVDADIERFYRQPWVMVASDGGIEPQHPRGAGTFSRVMGPIVRERQWLTLEEAVRKSTSLPAETMGIPERGVVKPGTAADLVVFDPRTVADQATYEHPALPPAGIEYVFVNGVAVLANGQLTRRTPGRAIRSVPNEMRVQ